MTRAKTSVSDALMTAFAPHGTDRERGGVARLVHYSLVNGGMHTAQVVIDNAKEHLLTAAPLALLHRWIRKDVRTAAEQVR